MAHAQKFSIVSEMWFCCSAVLSDGLSKISDWNKGTKMLSVNENLNQWLKTKSEMWLNSKIRCAQWVSKASEMLDNLRLVPAQHVSKMSKMTKLYLIKGFLNRPLETRAKQSCKEGVQNVRMSLPTAERVSAVRPLHPGFVVLSMPEDRPHTLPNGVNRLIYMKIYLPVMGLLLY